MTDLAAYVALRRPLLLRAAATISGERNGAEDLLQCAFTSVLSREETLRRRAQDVDLTGRPSLERLEP